MKRACCSVPYPEPAGVEFAPLRGLPQSVPSLWYDADFANNRLTGGAIQYLQPRFGTTSYLTPVGGLGPAPRVAFGSKTAIPGGSAFQGAAGFGALQDSAGGLAALAQSVHVVSGALPPAGATFDATGYMGIGTWYTPEFWPFFLRRAGATDWRFGISSGAPVEFAQNIYALAGRPFVFACRMQPQSTFLRLHSGATSYEMTVPNYANSPGFSSTLALGYPAGYSLRVWRGSLACYGVMTQAPFGDADVRRLTSQLQAYYGI